ncbi:hypothetical protein ABTY61_06580 [Kitasatospora sp. NPDC096128]|uniref:hypothetical protein n=1 Tax=Kitasatospora sp. NPDC096128 TaxID=3155547 RepID=UPI0033304C14
MEQLIAGEPESAPDIAFGPAAAQVVEGRFADRLRAGRFGSGYSGHPPNRPNHDDLTATTSEEERTMTTRDDHGTQPDESAQERSAEERSITAPTPADVREKAAGPVGGRQRSAEERSITAPTPADVRRKGEGPQPGMDNRTNRKKQSES